MLCMVPKLWLSFMESMRMGKVAKNASEMDNEMIPSKANPPRPTCTPCPPYDGPRTNDPPQDPGSNAREDYKIETDEKRKT